MSELGHNITKILHLCSDLLNIHQLNLSKCREINVIETLPHQESYSSFSSTKKKFKYCSYKKCVKRFDEFTESLLMQLDWTHTVVAGGSINLIVTGQKMANYPASDIDIYFYGCDAYHCLNNVLTYLRTKCDIVVFQRRCIITVLIRNHSRIIQLMNVNYNSFENILEDFDIPPSQILYNGREFLATSACITSIIRQKIEYREPTIKLPRLVKYLKRGYSFRLYNNCQIIGDNIYECEHCDIDQHFKDDAAIRCTNKYIIVTEESEQRLLFLMKTIFSSQYQLVVGDVENICDTNWKQYYDENTRKDIKQIHNVCYLSNIRLNNVIVKNIFTFKHNEDGTIIKYLDVLIESQEQLDVFKNINYHIRENVNFKKNNWCRHKEKCAIRLARYNLLDRETTSSIDSYSDDSESDDIPLTDIKCPGILRVKMKDQSVFQKKKRLLSINRFHNYLKVQTLKINIILNPYFCPRKDDNDIVIYLSLVSLRIL